MPMSTAGTEVPLDLISVVAIPMQSAKIVPDSPVATAPVPCDHPQVTAGDWEKSRRTVESFAGIRYSPGRGDGVYGTFSTLTG
jgi:hypothetical protein